MARRRDQAVEPHEAQLQAAPQEQLDRLFSRPDGVPSRPHAHGLHPQCSPHAHVVCSPAAAPLLAEVHLQPVPPGHGTAHPHLSSQPISIFSGVALHVALFSVHDYGHTRCQSTEL